MLVERVVQVKMGRRSQRMPGARMPMMVVMMLMALRVVPMEEIWMAHIQ